MKKSLLFSLVLSCISSASFAADGDAATASWPHHRMYGFFQTNSEFDQYGFSTLWTDDYHKAWKGEPGEGAEMIWPYNGYVGSSSQVSGVLAVYAGAAIDYVYYAPQYEYGIMTGLAPAKFVSHNMLTGERKELGQWTDSYQKRVMDMTYDIVDKKLYALTYDQGTTCIEEVDPETGEFWQKNNWKLSVGVGTLAADRNGDLWCIGSAYKDQEGAGVLYKFNKRNGKLTKMFDTKLYGMSGGQTMEFDLTTGDLYWASTTYGYRDVYGEADDDSPGRTYMMRIRFDSDGVPQGMDAGDEIGEKAVMRAMYIPYVLAGDNAPAAPSNLKVVAASDGSHKATLSWVNPTSTFGGNALADIKSITITRDDEVVKTFDGVKMGEAMTYVDESGTTDSEYKYAVYATNSVGDGSKAIDYQYIGLDVPAQPENLFVKLGDGSATATISWDPATVGAHGNPIDPKSVTFDVVRWPDNTVVAKDITENSVTDNNIRRLGSYYYEVVAHNSVGSSSSFSASWIMGKAYDVNEDKDYEETFEDQSRFSNTWVGFDGNGDGYSWMVNSSAPSQLVGDGFDNGVVYLINPLFTPSDITTTDEWLLAPPIKISDDEDYVIEFTARCWTPENLSVTCGSRNLRQDQKPLVDFVLTPTLPENESDPFTFHDIIVDLPKGAGYKCFGIHLTTPMPQEVTRNTFLQINDVQVRRKQPGDVTGIKTVTGNANSGTEQIYNANGMKLSAPQRGLNIVKGADGTTRKVVVK